MEDFIMNKKEREQLKVFELIKNTTLTKKAASIRLGVSNRWVRKKYKRYLEEGDIGIVHKSRGKESSRKWDTQEKALTLELLSSSWAGFGPTFVSEKLKELHNIKVSSETLRQYMTDEGIWQPKCRRLVHRQRRERRSMIGMMVQLDGSPHDWFEGRGPKCTLLVFIDDATSRIMWLEFAPSEALIPLMQSTCKYIQKYGKPHTFYVDHGSVFHVNLNNQENEKKTQWERALHELNIEVIHAHSPQAKGRVERANHTLQDRLVKELRLAAINSIEDANRFVQSGNFIDKHNTKFAVQATETGDTHRSVDQVDLNKAFCIREERVLANDHTIQYNKQIFQLTKEQKTIVRPKNIITILKSFDGSIKLSIRSTILEYTEIKGRSKPLELAKTSVIDTHRKPSENSRLWVAGRPPLSNSPEVRVG